MSRVSETEQSIPIYSVFPKGGQLKSGLVTAEANAQLESSSSRNLKAPERQSYQKWLKSPFIVLA